MHPVIRQRPQEQSGRALRQSNRQVSCATGTIPIADDWASIQGGLLQGTGVRTALATPVPPMVSSPWLAPPVAGWTRPPHLHLSRLGSR